MATTINADTSTGGAIVTGDASGVLGLQAAGSTQVTISTSGVVLPVFLPMVPSLATATGATEPLAIALSINVGSSLVDVSPLSTLGALCVAALGKDEADPKLYFKLLAWGMAMTVVGAALCQIGAMLF